MNCQINFPSGWIDASALEEVLQSNCEPHGSDVYEILFVFQTGCKVMVDAAVRLLSLLNQLDHRMCRVHMNFEDGETGTMGYLDRMGFFDNLSKNIDVLPKRPVISGVKLYGGTNSGLVEITCINRDHRDDELPSLLTDAVVRLCGNRPDTKELEGAAWTIFAELIDNIFSHSDTPLDGYAALQFYPKGKSLKVAVSDSGIGIMDTLRPTLKNEFPALDCLSDTELLVEVFRQGISRHGADRGCGLKGSAAKAIKYRADLDVRLPNIRVLLTPGREGYLPNQAHCYENLPLLWGTHICFTFKLDTK